MTTKNTLQNKTILLVNPGSLRKKFIWERLKELGLTVICLNLEKKTIAEPYMDNWILADITNTQECVQNIKNFLIEHPEIHIDGVITFWDECVLLTSELAEEFNWVGIPFVVVKKIKNKYVFRKTCEDYGLVAPRHRLLQNFEDIPKLSRELRFPLVIKPVYGASSAFVIKVENEQALEAAFLSIKERLPSFELAPEWVNWEIFVEEYIGGDEVDLDILLQGGELKYISITDNNKTREPYFVETGEVAPSNLSPEQQNILVEMSYDTLKKFGIKNGCFHFEAKLSEHGPVPIEINLRMGGGDVFVFSKLVWGVDLIENSVRIALNIPLEIDKPSRPLTYLASGQFLPDHSGILRELTIHDKLENQDYFVELYFQKKIGDTFLSPPEGYDSCLGWVTVSGRSAVEAQKNLGKGMSLVAYKLEKI